MFEYRCLLLIQALLMCVLLVGCGRQHSEFDEILERGELRILISRSAFSYFDGPRGAAGIEYDLVLELVRQIGVKAKMIVVANTSELLARLQKGEGDLAVGALSVFADKHLRFAAFRHNIGYQVIYKRGNNRPRTIEDISGKRFVVAANSAQERHLQKMVAKYPDLEWQAHARMEGEALVAQVNEGIIDYTLVDINLYKLVQNRYPESKVAFYLPTSAPLGWALLANTYDDDSFYNKVVAFVNASHANGFFESIYKHYYDHLKVFDYVNARSFLRAIKTRLPRYRAYFQQAAKLTDNLDWRLLAAIAYQESHWNQKAVSATGVRGLMMLTRMTANQIGVDDRRDPQQSILGGALYLNGTKKRLPKHILEPDRSWIALASYNIGSGHVRDAMKLAVLLDKDPDKWSTLMSTLPLLANKKWYKKTRYGYARGLQPVAYVNGIRNFYDILYWLEK